MPDRLNNTQEIALTLFRLDASIRTDGSHSRQLADLVEQEWRHAHPDSAVVRRSVGTEPLPAEAWAEAVLAGRTTAGQRTPAQAAAAALATLLVDELVSAEALVFAVPLYNFGVPQHFKSWVDLVITEPRMASGTRPAIGGKPAVLVVARGGAYGPGTPRDGWDHGTPWVRRILAEVWQLDLRVVEAELTLVGVNPALHQFEQLASQMRDQAEKLAVEHGRALAGARVDAT